MKKNGFTLIETVISLGIFMLITLSVINMLAYTSKATERMTAKSELLEAARIALDVLSIHIKSSDKVEITNDSLTKSVTKIQTYNYSDAPPDRVFEHFPRLSSDSLYYHWLWFGGNELAMHIAKLEASYAGNILSLTVITDDRTSSDARTVVEPVRVTAKIKIHNEVVVK